MAKQHKHSTKKLLLWGCITPQGPGPAVPTRGIMDGQKYLQVLHGVVLPYEDEISVFMQDNAPPHKSTVVMDTLKKAKFELLDWPPLSPDLSSIENIWGLLKSKVNRCPVSTLDDLEKLVLDVWHNDAELKNALQKGL